MSKAPFPPSYAVQLKAPLPDFLFFFAVTVSTSSVMSIKREDEVWGLVCAIITLEMLHIMPLNTNSGNVMLSFKVNKI